MNKIKLCCVTIKMTYDISDFLPIYPDIGDEDFNIGIKSKNEFRTPSIDKTEEFPSKKGELFAHQVLISRLMSSHTPYDGVLLMHEMGTGKTCSASAIIQQVRSEKNGIDNFIYVAKNKSLLDNFDDEFRGKCTIDDYSAVKNLGQIGIQKLTYDGFVKEYNSKIPTNCVIVIDEIHNIRDKNKSYIDSGTYNSFYKILKSVVNAKIILLSGTPIVDKPNEIASVMNLILPDNKKLPTGLDFDNQFIDKNGEITNKQELIDAFSGRISYIKAMESDVRKVFIGVIPEQFKHFKLDSSVMSAEQTIGYMKALKQDEEGGSPAFSNSLQASDIVIGGEYGVGLKPMVLKGATIEERIKDLEKYSSKYAASIRTIIKARREGKNVFVFNKHVDGGGLKMFASILTKFGFTEVTKEGIKLIDKEAPRFVLLTGAGGVDTTNLERIGGKVGKGWGSDLGIAVKRFNRPDNVNGKIIGVVLASEAISEGYSFNNVQVIDIHSPWFNFQKVAQVISRGIRAGSHRGITEQRKKDGVDGNIDVEIHLRVSTPVGETNEKYPDGIDTYTYKTAEAKDIIVKKIERVIKQYSIDSYLARKRNFRDSSLDNSRDCDYTKCKYKSFPNMDIKEKTRTDYSTYELYYESENQEIISAIVEMFKQEDVYSLSLDDIIIKYDKKISRPIVNALIYMVNDDIPIKRGNSDIFFLREQNNIYYLVKTFSNKATILDMYYAQNKHTEIDSETVRSSTQIDFDKVISIQSLNFEMRAMSDLEKESVLEKNIPNGNEYVLEKFKGLWGNIDGVMYSWFLMTKKGSGRVLNTEKQWVDCSAEETQVIRTYVNDLKKSFAERASKIFGKTTG
jgi:superfamily II DNA or RNA helicase